METPSTSLQREEEQLQLETQISIAKDAVDIWTNIQHHNRELSCKRQFLMGLASSSNFERSARFHVGEESVLPESFLRKDDMFYEEVRDCVERAFGRCNKTEEREDLEVSDLRKMFRIILTLLDDLSNNGLYNLAKALTESVVTLVKTRPQMKRFIKSTLLQFPGSQNPVEFQVKIQKEISQLLKNPKNFRQNYRKHAKLTLKSYYSDVMHFLKSLKRLHGHTLVAIDRKLSGIQRYRPQLSSRPSSLNKPLLVNKVRKLSLDMINQLGESDELQEPLAKAMAVARLSSKSISCSEGFSASKFCKLTPEIETLQNEIVKAINLLDQRFSKEEMKQLLNLLDPDFKGKGKSLKTAIKNLLKELLFECIDMDGVPEYLSDALSLINKRAPTAHISLSKDLMEDDVECILNVGAHLKQILWDCDLNGQLEQDFECAYMDELSESDDGDIFDDDDDDQMPDVNSLGGCQINCYDLSEDVGSTGESHDDSVNSYPSACGNSLKSTHEFASKNLGDDVCDQKDIKIREVFMLAAAANCSSPLVSPSVAEGSVGMGRQNVSINSSMKSLDPDNKPLEQKPVSENHKNQYVAFQEVCDGASLAAYQLIGHVLDGFGKKQAGGLSINEKSYLRSNYSRAELLKGPDGSLTDKHVDRSIIIDAVRKVIPSFSDSQLEMVKKFMRN